MWLSYFKKFMMILIFHYQFIFMDVFIFDDSVHAGFYMIFSVAWSLHRSRKHVCLMLRLVLGVWERGGG